MKYLKNVATLKLNENGCTGCGTCVEVCPHNVLTLRDGKAHIADLDACMECGACAGNCPFGALEVHKGVGCAAAVLHSLLTGEAPSCG
jgi:ferredoxin